MPLNHSIRISLDLKDKNITFNQSFCEEKIMKGILSKVYYGTLTYHAKACPCCGVKNENYSIVKNGFLTTKIKWLNTTNWPTYLYLKKQRFLCRHCHSSFLAESLEFEKHCFIARRVKQSITLELSDAISFKDLAKRHSVSSTTVIRTLRSFGKELTNQYDSLPPHLSFDEFTGVKEGKRKYNFIYSDSVSHQILDILPDNLSSTIEKHFLNYSLKARNQVKTIVVDMNAGYFKLAKRLFPNASVIIDRFHLVQLISRSLNITRIKTMNLYRTSRSEDLKIYRKMKRYWKLFLKDSRELNYTDYHYHRLFKAILPETEIMDYLLSLNNELKDTYRLYQELLYCCKTNDFDAFSAILSTSDRSISQPMITSVTTLKKHLPRIENTFNYQFSNGPLEGSINKIKLIKRIAYGYRNFYNYKYRILISFKGKKKATRIN
ncbi:ISL3 family transposase [Vagococcus fluvialis]|uniref:ISL3 family transposase n=1 Tax=Vagococcus fluvialis TaxID=2738 RepID=UPI001D09F601|nr:ISL3 family transposase [Vagococcus fluvialis]UDM80503.1 ISL3 family transposase [Vagococcus fluvialis]UDM80711.1 ISL3 family transposase [Vagococcus fluvialis]